MPLHRAAAEGFSRETATYARGRPEYPPEADAWLRDALGVGPGRAVLEVGAGTGKFTARLAAAGAEVSAVEPSAAMRAACAAAVPGARLHEGAAEALPFADACFDAVVCAQAFHWFANPQALAEFRRVLRPGGRLGLIWNVRDERVDWVAALTHLIAAYEGAAPRYASGAWRKAFPAPGFGPLAAAEFPHGHTGRPEDVVVARVASISFIAALPEETRADVAEAVRALIARYPALRGRDTVTFPYLTAAYWCERL